jgi:hypothetical protein
LQGSVATATARIQVIIEAAEKAAAGIIDDAEAQARNYLEESRVRADRIADQRAQEMSDLADTLIERAEAVKRQSDELLRALDQAKLQVEEKFRAEAAAISAPQSEFQPQSAPPQPPVYEAPVEVEQAPTQAQVPHLKPVGEQWEAQAPAVSEPPPIPGAEAPFEEEPVASQWAPPTVAPASTPPPPTPGAPPSDGARLLATQMAVAGSSRAEIESRLQNEFGIYDAGPMLDAILGREA